MFRRSPIVQGVRCSYRSAHDIALHRAAVDERHFLMAATRSLSPVAPVVWARSEEDAAERMAL
jgi:hypothetical protein